MDIGLWEIQDEVGNPVTVKRLPTQGWMNLSSASNKFQRSLPSRYIADEAEERGCQ